MPLVITGKTVQSAQGDLLPGVITGINPTTCLVDGASTTINVLTGHPYFPAIGDRVALTRFGSNYLAMPVDIQGLFNAPDDCWHAVGDPLEPQFQNGFLHFANDMGHQHGDATRFTRDRAGVVWIEGLVQMPAFSPNGNGQLIFILPPGYRPAYQLCFSVVTGNGIYQVGVDPNGSVYIQYGPSTAAGFLSLETVNFVSEDGPNAPVWTDLGPVFMTGNGWQTSSVFSSTLPTKSGAPYPGARACLDNVGDVHLSGMVSNLAGGQQTTNILQGLNSFAPFTSNLDTDVDVNMIMVAASGTPGFARLDVHSNTSAGSVAVGQYGNNSATCAWLSLDGFAQPGGNVPTRYQNGTLINSWLVAGSTAATAGMRINRIGTVYLRGLIKGTANTVADAFPFAGADLPGSPNVYKLFPGICQATAGCGGNRTDVGFAGIVPGVTLYTGQAAGTATTTFTSLAQMKWSSRSYSR